MMTRFRMAAALVAALLTLAAATPAAAQTTEDKPAAANHFVADNPPAAALGADPADVASIGSILAALYEGISGPAGPRDWDRMRSLFLPGARLIPTDPGAAGGYDAQTVEAFFRSVAANFMDNAFYEREVARRVERYGNIAHVFSTYESRSAPDAEPFDRGINSIQLYFDGTRWWVVSIMWQAESTGVPLPGRYLPE